MPFELRPAEAADAPALARLWTLAFVESGTTPRTDPYDEAEVSRLLADNDGCVATARDGRVIGAVLLADHGAPSAHLTAGTRDGQLLLLAVDPDARSAGAGRALVTWCLESAALRGLLRVWLWSRPGQSAAHRIYESLGFERSPENDFEAGGEQVKVYVRPLPPDGPTIG